MPNSESYKISECCGSECYCSYEKEQCYGQVHIIGEEFEYDEYGNKIDSYWIHLCEGHINWPGEYIKENIKK